MELYVQDADFLQSSICYLVSSCVHSYKIKGVKKCNQRSSSSLATDCRYQLQKLLDHMALNYALMWFCKADILFVMKWLRKSRIIFFNLYSGGWSPIGSTRHCGYQWPIVPALGDYDDGEIGGMIGRGNRST
jgi:hypothetical protein